MGRTGAAARTVAGLLLACMVTEATAAVPATVDVEAFVREDKYLDIKISPTGDYYAATTPTADRTTLSILRRADKQVVASAVGVGGSAVADFWWVADDRVVFAMSERFGRAERPYPTGELFSVGIDGGRTTMVVGFHRDPGLVSSTGGTYERATLVDPLVDEPRKALVSVSRFESKAQSRLERVDVLTGRRETLAIAPVDGATFTLDPQGEARFAAGSGDDNANRLYYRTGRDGDWTLVNDEANSGQRQLALGFSRDGRIAYLRTERAPGPDVVEAMDVETGRRSVVAQDPVVTPFAMVLGTDRRSVVGLQYMDASVTTRLLDDGSLAAKTQLQLEKAFPGQAVSVTSATRDGSLVLFKVWDERTPGDFYLFDTRSRAADGVFVSRQWIDPKEMASKDRIEFAARDGLKLRGYLTRRTEDRGHAMPLVVIPHGGPFGIFDGLEFEDDVQLLASAGYAILQVNFRGSGNYGAWFQRAGAREWGGRMQDDLTDATRWAIETGIAEPGRICIYGASYGGYAALMGAASQPDLYRCAVGYAGVYDLEELHRKGGRVPRWVGNWMDEWVGERGSLAARSPVNLADRIRVPVLLVAGGKDEIAPIEHSERMEAALRRTGGDVETLYVPTEVHGFYDPGNRQAFYERLLAFLRRNIGDARQVASDAAADPGDDG